MSDSKAVTCPACNGSGGKENEHGIVVDACRPCAGTGTVLSCPRCGGGGTVRVDEKGKVWAVNCPSCAGTGAKK